MSEQPKATEQPAEQGVTEDQLEEVASGGGGGFMNVYSNGESYSGATVDDF